MEHLLILKRENNMINEIEKRLEEIMASYKPSRVQEAMSYSLLAGGKRLRPVFFLEVLRSYGVDYHQYLDIACAIEMIHSYSLIHDDLPGMDDDSLRRGKPTCHIKFDEATAILAGDGLLNHAASVILKSDIDSELKVKCLDLLYDASGIEGMIYGQNLDMESEKKDIDLKTLQDIHYYKTGALMSVSMQLGAMIAAPQDVDVWKELGFKIGLAFQIQDDILDVTATSGQLGKNAGSDIANGKATYIKFLGMDASSKAVEDTLKECSAMLYSLQCNHGIYLGVIEQLKKRVN